MSNPPEVDAETVERDWTLVADTVDELIRLEATARTRLPSQHEVLISIGLVRGLLNRIEKGKDTEARLAHNTAAWNAHSCEDIAGGALDAQAEAEKCAWVAEARVRKLEGAIEAAGIALDTLDGEP